MKTCKKKLHQYPFGLVRCPECRKKTHLRNALKWNKTNSARKNASIRKYEAKRLNATPSWLTPTQLKQMTSIYGVATLIQKLSSKRIHVDHIIPLQGKEVSGLHVPWNLQLLPASKNCSKGNRI